MVSWNGTSQDPLRGPGRPWSDTQQVQARLLISAALPPVFLLEGMGVCSEVNGGGRNKGMLQGRPGLLGYSDGEQPEAACRASLLTDGTGVSIREGSQPSVGGGVGNRDLAQESVRD